MADNNLLGGEIVGFEVMRNRADTEPMIAVSLNLSSIGEVFVDGVIFANIVAGVMKSGIGNSDNWGTFEFFDAFFNLGGDDRNMKWSALFGELKMLETFSVDLMIGGKKFARGNHAH